MFSVIFDMDGTLLDTQKICIPAWEYGGELQGISGLGNHIENVCGMNRQGWNAYLINLYPELDTEKFNEDVRKYISDNMVVRFKPGAQELMDFLDENNIKYAIASGTSRQGVEHHINEVNSIDRFEVIVCGSDVKNGKPAPDVFLLTAQKMGVAPETCYVFEDSENGIRAAHGAGMKVFGIEDVATFNEEAKKLMFKQLNSLDEAISIFKELL